MLIDFDGFDSYLSAADFAGNNYIENGVAIGAGRFGGNSVNINTATKFIRKIFGDRPVGFYGFAFKYAADAASGVVAHVLNAANALQYNIFLNTTTRQLAIRLGSSTTIIATGATIIQPDTWYYIEANHVNQTTDMIQVRVNGVVDIDITSGITLGNIGQIGFGQNFNNQAALSNFFIDDFYHTDNAGMEQNSFLNEVRIESLRPTADGFFTGFESNEGVGLSRFTQVDEVTPDGDMTYVSSNIAGAAVTFTSGQQLSNNPAAILGVKARSVARKDDTGPRSVAPVIKNMDNSLIEGTSVALTTGYKVVSQIYSKDPRDNLEWTRAKVEGLEVGLKITV